TSTPAFASCAARYAPTPPAPITNVCIARLYFVHARFHAYDASVLFAAKGVCRAQPDAKYQLCKRVVARLHAQMKRRAIAQNKPDFFSRAGTFFELVGEFDGDDVEFDIATTRAVRAGLVPRLGGHE